LVTAGIHTLILVFTIAALLVGVAALWYAAKQLTVAVKGTQYQNAILVIDQSSEIAVRLGKEPKLLEVLENKTVDNQSILGRLVEFSGRIQELAYLQKS
jgi:hypothetical protein